uniref:Uncharacterized protein n=1 Tax=Fundulus heteroclitus TaxID=8078 RepID=A0A3Q2ST90_FUNHE
MPGKLKAKIVAGRHLPVMDRASDLTDAFVEVSDDAFTAAIFLKSPNVQKNYSRFSFSSSKMNIFLVTSLRHCFLGPQGTFSWL